MNKISNSKSQKAKTGPVLTTSSSYRLKKDYINNPEYIAYSRKRLTELKSRIPALNRTTKEVQKILKENGFWYPNKYVQDCLCEARDTWNIHVIKALETFVEKNFPRPEDIFMVIPSEKSSVKRLQPNKETFAKRLGLAKTA